MAFDDLASQPEWQAWNACRGLARVPGGESMLDVQARAVSAMLRLRAAWPEGEIVIVSHADVIKAILAHVSRRAVGSVATMADRCGLHEQGSD